MSDLRQKAVDLVVADLVRRIKEGDESATQDLRALVAEKIGVASLSVGGIRLPEYGPIDQPIYRGPPIQIGDPMTTIGTPPRPWGGTTTKAPFDLTTNLGVNP
jgi:hypothetical protein